MPHLLSLLALTALFAFPAPSVAAPPLVEWAGSSWSGTANLTAKIGGVGSIKGVAAMSLDFGPQAAPALAANEFLVLLDDGIAPLPISGTWSLDEKGRPVLALDTTNVEADLQMLLAEVCFEEFGDPDCEIFYALDVVIDPADFKTRLKAKDDDGVVVVSAKGKLPFELFFDGERVTKVAISFRSKDLVAD